MSGGHLKAEGPGNIENDDQLKNANYLSVLRTPVKQIPTSSSQPSTGLVSASSALDPVIVITKENNQAVPKLQPKKAKPYLSLWDTKPHEAVGRRIKARPPSVQEQVDAHRVVARARIRYSSALSYQHLSYGQRYVCLHGYRDGDSEEESDSMDELDYEFEKLFINEKNFSDYESAVSDLQNDRAEKAKKTLFDLVHKAVEPAFFAYALVTFKMVLRECDLYNDCGSSAEVVKSYAGDIEDSIRLLIRANAMQPAASFLLGMMSRFGFLRELTGDRAKNLRTVVHEAVTAGVVHIDPHTMVAMDMDDVYRWTGLGVGVKHNAAWLKAMALEALYEIAMDTVSLPRYSFNALSEVFEVLCKADVPEAMFSHATALLQRKFGGTLEEDLEKVTNLLKRASRKFSEASNLLLGTFPFYSGINRKLSSLEISGCIAKLEEALASNYSKLCTIDERNKDKAAHCLAAEYYSKRSWMVLQNKTKAVEMLTTRKMWTELQSLESLDGK